VLVLTLYATQYSGNTLLGFSGKAYRVGFSWVMSLHFMTAIIVFYLLLAPRLHVRAKSRGYVTPADFLHDRFGSRALTTLASIVMVVALGNYLLTQLVAMGKAVEGLTGDESPMAYTCGVVGLALVIIIYETLGGLRAVAWTDVLQGLVLIIGFSILLVLVFQHFGTPAQTTERLLASNEWREKATPPNASIVREWFSYIFIVGIGATLYPQAMQRIFAARSPTVLRRSLAVMVFFPMVTTTIVVLVGVTAIVHVGTLEGAATDRVLTTVCRVIQESSSVGYWLVVVLFAAILAAIMSTADSALLSISSMLTGDIYRRWIAPDASQERLTKMGKILSWALLAILVALSIPARSSTLVKIVDRKFDILVQLAPAFFLGLHWPRLRAGPVLAGLILGLVVAVSLPIAGYSKLWGIHPGLYGLAVNAVVAILGSLRIPRD
jgi:SSS family solute:Na+ symporter/sodium/pantothenate symporter